ncbi:UDP-galactose transporter [Hyaloscypha finlandica]|nr:UDP-galactose transporter [Hyaloscypha finlandica]
MQIPQFPESWQIGLQSAAYLSALCLVAIQVGIGIIMKSSQTGGKYTFSSSGLVIISEFLKMILSASLLLRHCMKQLRNRAEESGPGYAFLIPLTPSPRSSSPDELIGLKSIEEEEEEEEKASEETLREDVELGYDIPVPKTNLFVSWVGALCEVSVETRYGFANLALLYCLINNTIFVSYKLADPGTIALTRSGVIFITAFVMVTALRSKISTVQWVAIVIQLCGLITTQYRPEVGSSYPYSTYIVLLSQVFVSSVAGVYNQSLLKGDSASLHAQNTMLYAFGVVINAMIHTTIRIVKPEEPSLFAGYTNLPSYLVILSNVFIGLAITAVYKYADAVIKCLATAVATGILLFLSPAISGTSMTPLTVPGGLIVFISSWLYVTSPAVKSPDEESIKFIILPLATITTILIITLLETVSFSDHISKPTSPNTSIIHSPFNTTLGFMKWNHHLPERIPLIQKYEPFFHTVHYSMPLPDEKDSELHNLTHDAWQNPLVNYAQIARTMQFILDQPAKSSANEITGLLFLHFDAWIDPLSFATEDFSKIWIAYTQAYGGPQYICGTSRAQFGGWIGLNADRNWHYPLLSAQADLASANTSYIFNKDEWCIGWSDIYYIPREYFADYVYLAAFYGAQNAFHELVIPTIMRIIDQTRREKDFSSIINYLGHCFGGCCAPGADMNQLMSHRCGHKLDYLGNWDVINAHYDRLDKEAERLGTEAEERETRRKFAEMVVRPPPNHWRWDQINFAFNETGLEPPPAAGADKEGNEREAKLEERSVVDGSEGAEYSKEWLARYG